jgi:predicted membrane protein
VSHQEPEVLLSVVGFLWQLYTFIRNGMGLYTPPAPLSFLFLFVVCLRVTEEAAAPWCVCFVCVFFFFFQSRGNKQTAKKNPSVHLTDLAFLLFRWFQLVTLTHVFSFVGLDRLFFSHIYKRKISLARLPTEEEDKKININKTPATTATQ